MTNYGLSDRKFDLPKEGFKILCRFVHHNRLKAQATNILHNVKTEIGIAILQKMHPSLGSLRRNPIKASVEHFPHCMNCYSLLLVQNTTVETPRYPTSDPT